MTIQKSIKYKSVILTKDEGDYFYPPQKSVGYELKLNVLEIAGNYVLHKDLLRHYNSQNQGTTSTKTRSEVRGGGKKPWRQKGTGRARAGSNRSPLWKGGGVIFGPKPKQRILKLNKKERKLALQTLLYSKRNNILLLEDEVLDSIVTRTKQFIGLFIGCQVELDQKILVIVSNKTKALKLSTRNIKNVELISASNLNTFSLLKAKQILLTTSALKNIKEIYCD